MAGRGPTVLLGYEDESISEKHKQLVNFTTSKIGGKPDWPLSISPSLQCRLCGFALPLVMQIYAPLDNSPYHRTLYLFGCVNPNCWNQSESWICIRSQTLESTKVSTDQKEVGSMSTTDWCDDADDWGSEEDEEENGNIIQRRNMSVDTDDQDDCFGNFGTNRIESCYNDEDSDIAVQLQNLTVEDPNANSAGAVGQLHSPVATAEIEGDESEVVCIDTPTSTQLDIMALFQEVVNRPENLEPIFEPHFVNVVDEVLTEGTPLSEHERDLLQEYQVREGVTYQELTQRAPMSDGGKGEALTLEKYERGVPAHGDAMFHQFLSQIQQNPGQIVRYCRDSASPLLLYPLHDIPTRCHHCGGDVIFEMQILPSLVTKLKLTGIDGVHLEFGTALVFACKRSCWAPGDSWREERVIVQAERI